MYTKTRAALHMLIIFAVFFLSDFFSLTAFQIVDSDTFYIFYAEALDICMNISSILIITYLYSKYILKKSLTEIYLGKPLPVLQWCIIGFVMPITMDIFYIFFIEGTFQWEDCSQSEMAYIIFADIFGLGLRTSLTEEVLFRGLAFASLQKELGKKAGIVFSSLLYTSVHFVHISSYSWNDLFFLAIASFISGMAYTLITCATGSIWSSVVIHILYNILSGNSDVLHISATETLFTICTYRLKSSNILIAGARGGDIDTALPSITGYLIVIVIAVLYIKKNQTNSV